MKMILCLLLLGQVFTQRAEPVFREYQPTVTNPQKGGDPVSDSSSVVASQPATTPSDDGAADEVFSEHPGYYVVMYTASWCGPCRNWKAAGNLERMKVLGYPVTQVDIDARPEYRRAVPCFEIVDRATRSVVWKRTGSTAPETIVANIPSKPAGPLVDAGNGVVTHTSAGVFAQPVRMQWDFEGNRNPSTTEMINHLAEHGVDATGMTRQEMAATHDRLHNGMSARAACPTCPTTTYRKKSGGRFFGLFK